MRRRRALIDEYLKAHDPAPSAAREPRSTAPSRAGAVPHPRRHGRRIGLPALAVATTLVAVAALAFMPGRASRTTDQFLSPEAAVAAASRSLEDDGILHWRFSVSVQPSPRSIAAQSSDPGFEEWIDLKTHATHQIFPEHPRDTLGTGPRKSWYNGKRTYRVMWPESTPDGRQIVVRTVRRRGEPIPPNVANTPIQQIRRLLRSAARGKATLKRATAELDGRAVPAVAIFRTKDVSDGDLQLVTWITREKTPRWIRSIARFTPDAKGRERGANASVVRREITIWQLLPRTPENIAKVEAPEFDPAKYKVTTQFLGPRKR